MRSADGGALLATFQNGLAEQGATASPMLLPAAPYLRDLADAERANAEGPPRTQRGLIPPERVRTLYEDQARTSQRAALAPAGLGGRSAR